MIGSVEASWAVEALIASSALMVVALLLRGPVRRAFGAHVAYALWALPVLRLALPPLPSGWYATTGSALQTAAVAHVLRVAEPVTTLIAAPTAAAAAAAGTGTGLGWLLTTLPLALAGLWVLGAIAFFAWHALAHRRFCARMLASIGQRAELDGISVIESDAASGPLAFGVVRRYVAFPRDFAARYEPEERDLALAHELGHHQRGDLIANWIALGVLALHWFNPIAWRAFRAFRADQEIANDARVLAGMNPMRRHTYACAIVKAAHPALYGSVATTCHLNTIDDLKGRLRVLTTRRTSRVRLAGGGVIVAALTLGGLGLTASGSAAAERVRSGVQRATGVDIAALVPPAMPATPTVTALAEMPEMPRMAAMPTDPATPAVRRSPVEPESATSARAQRNDTGPVVSPQAPMPAQSPSVSLPPEPPLPPEALRGTDGTYMVTTGATGSRIVRHGRYVQLGPNGQATLIGEDGTTARSPWPPRAPSIPEVRSQPCGDTGNRMTIEDQSDGHRRITVCTDRIAAASKRAAVASEAASARGAAAAARGAQLAANSGLMQRDAYSRALAGLRASRARMLDNPRMTAESRREALYGMDTAIAQLKRNLARLR